MDKQLMNDVAAAATQKALDSVYIAVKVLPPELHFHTSLYVMVNLWLHCTQHLVKYGDEQMKQSLVDIAGEINS